MNRNAWFEEWESSERALSERDLAVGAFQEAGAQIRSSGCVSRRPVGSGLWEAGGLTEGETKLDLGTWWQSGPVVVCQGCPWQGWVPGPSYVLLRQSLDVGYLGRCGLRWGVVEAQPGGDESGGVTQHSQQQGPWVLPWRGFGLSLSMSNTGPWGFGTRCRCWDGHWVFCHGWDAFLSRVLILFWRARKLQQCRRLEILRGRHLSGHCGSHTWRRPPVILGIWCSSLSHTEEPTCVIGGLLQKWWSVTSEAREE